MVLDEHLEESLRIRKEAEKRNPLLKLNLGELVRKMQLLALQQPYVLIPKDKRDSTTQWVLSDYKEYDALVDELNRREREYNSYKPEPKF